MMSDVCVMTGGVGLSCNQLLVYGAPVITHNNMDFQKPEVDVIIKGVSGYCFEMDNATSMVDVIRNWLSKEVERVEIRKACQSIIEQYYTPSYQRKVIGRAVSDLLQY